MFDSYNLRIGIVVILVLLILWMLYLTTCCCSSSKRVCKDEGCECDENSCEKRKEHCQSYPLEKVGIDSRSPQLLRILTTSGLTGLTGAVGITGATVVSGWITILETSLKTKQCNSFSCKGKPKPHCGCDNSGRRCDKCRRWDNCSSKTPCDICKQPGISTLLATVSAETAAATADAKISVAPSLNIALEQARIDFRILVDGIVRGSAISFNNMLHVDLDLNLAPEFATRIAAQILLHGLATAYTFIVPGITSGNHLITIQAQLTLTNIVNANTIALSAGAIGNRTLVVENVCAAPLLTV